MCFSVDSFWLVLCICHGVLVACNLWHFGTVFLVPTARKEAVKYEKCLFPFLI